MPVPGIEGNHTHWYNHCCASVADATLHARTPLPRQCVISSREIGDGVKAYGGARDCRRHEAHARIQAHCSPQLFLPRREGPHLDLCPAPGGPFLLRPEPAEGLSCCVGTPSAALRWNLLTVPSWRACCSTGPRVYAEKLHNWQSHASRFSSMEPAFFVSTAPVSREAQVD